MSPGSTPRRPDDGPAPREAGGTPPATTLDAQLRASVARHGDRPALVLEDGATLTYTELDGAVDEAVAWLRAQGVVPGDRVLLQLDKGPAFLVLHLADMRLGAVTVPVNPAAAPDETAYTAADCEPALLVHGVRDGEPPTGGADGPRVVRLDPDATARTEGRDRGERSTRADASSSAHPSPGAAPPPAPDDLACLLYTSGTTGRPKGARLLQRNLASNVAVLHDAWGWSPDDVLHHALPLFHVHGLFVAASVALAAGACVRLAPRFEPESTWRALASGEVTLFMGVPTMYHRLLASAPADPPRPLPVRLCTSGSAPLRPETLAAFEALTGHVILERYGMTEVGMAASNPLHGRRVPGSVGPALPGVELRVVDRATGAPCAPDEVGEVLIGGPSVFDGYRRRPEQTAEAFTPDGLLRSGDLGRLDADGYLHLVGRAKELVISGGFNVYPREVEAALDSHPDVVESAVCGVPDDDLGEVVAAGVVLRPGATVDAEALRRFAKERLAAYKAPRRVAFLDALPRNAMGKVMKAALAGLPELRGG